MIDCPYCLTPQSFHRGDNCESCGKKVPRQYIEIARTKPPIWIVTFGPTQHGKSTLLGSTTFLMERLSAIVPRSFHTYLDDFTIKRVAEIQRGQHMGDVLGPTVKNDSPEPLLIALKNFPSAKESQIFVIFDLAGEVVEEITNRVMDDSSEPPLYARAVAKAKTVWFIVSLYDIQRDAKSSGKSINNLFWSYQHTMAQLNVSLKNRDILVIYTKADLLLQQDNINQLEIPSDVYKYFETDPYYDLGNRGAEKPALLDHNDYLTTLERVSDQLQSFTQDEVPGGSAFVAMAEDSETNLYFTIDSAQGSASGTRGELGIQIKRYRVVDPLLWTIMLSSDEDPESAAAIVLPVHGNGQVYSMNLPIALYDALRSHNIHPSTYFMGETKAVFSTGNAPVDVIPPSGRVPLIGTILERLPKDSIAIILVDDLLPIDIDDFAETTWDDRLLLIGTDKIIMNTRIRWKYQAQTVTEVGQSIREFTRQVELSRTK